MLTAQVRVHHVLNTMAVCNTSSHNVTQLNSSDHKPVEIDPYHSFQTCLHHITGRKAYHRNKIDLGMQGTYHFGPLTSKSVAASISIVSTARS